MPAEGELRSIAMAGGAQPPPGPALPPSPPLVQPIVTPRGLLPTVITTIGQQIDSWLQEAASVLIPNPQQLLQVNPDVDLGTYYTNVKGVLVVAGKTANPQQAAKQAQKTILTMPIPTRVPGGAAVYLPVNTGTEILNPNNNPPTNSSESSDIITTLTKLNTQTLKTAVAPTPTPPIPPTICTAPFGSINPFDWLAYVGCVIGQFYDAIQGLFSGLPSSWSSIQTTLSGYWTDFTNFLADPSTFFQSIVTALFKSSSPSVVDNLITQTQSTIKSVTDQIQSSSANQSWSNISSLSLIYNAGQSVGKQISGPVTVDTTESNIATLDSEIEAAFLTYGVFEFLIEKIPTLNDAGLVSLVHDWLEARGIFSIIRGTFEPYLQHNQLKMLDYQLNRNYLNTLPDLATLMRLYDLGKVTQSVYFDWGQQVSGIASDRFDLMRIAGHQVIGLEDLITWNRRHTDQPVNYATMQNNIGINYDDYGKYFNERQWTDPPIRVLATLAKLGKLTSGDFQSYLIRAGYRTDILPGQSMSDYNAMMLYFTDVLSVPVENKLLTSELKLYLNKQATVEQLQAVASTVYKNPNDLNEYMQTALNDYNAKWLKPKYFTYTQLVKFAEANVDVSAFMDVDLTAEGWDTAHKAALEQFILNTLKAAGVNIEGQSTASTSTTSS